ncbi:hypothetical protein N9L12_04395 [Luminiphilus sp.]|nr:hypothetical protein [Luminiphilus sp.]
MAPKRCFSERDKDTLSHHLAASGDKMTSQSAMSDDGRVLLRPRAVPRTRPTQRCEENLPRSNERSKLHGYVTTAVVSILAILALLATRVTIGVTVDAYRAAGINQGLTATLYAGEVGLKDSVTRISNNLSDLTGNPSCFIYDFGSVTVTDTDSGLSQDYDMQYYAAFIETRNSRDLYRVFATAEASIFKATVSQIASIDSSAGTVYLMPGTWSNMLPNCS